jgi:hypothetical protein
VPTNTETPTNFVTETPTSFVTETPTQFTTEIPTSFVTETATITATPTAIPQETQSIQSRSFQTQSQGCPSGGFYLVQGSNSVNALQNAINCANLSSVSPYKIYVSGVTIFDRSINLISNKDIIFYGQGIGIGTPNSTVFDGNNITTLFQIDNNQNAIEFRNIIMKNGVSSIGVSYRSGGAIQLRSGTLRIYDSLFESNKTVPNPSMPNQFFPGGVISVTGGNLEVFRSIFKANYADYGGAIHLVPGSFINVTLRGECNRFENNVVRFHSSALVIERSNLPSTMIKSSFINNSSDYTEYSGGRYIETYGNNGSAQQLDLTGSYFRFGQNTIVNLQSLIMGTYVKTTPTSPNAFRADNLAQNDPTANYLTDPYRGNTCVMGQPAVFPTLPPTPTPGIICPASLQGQAQPANVPGVGGDACQVITPTATPTLECNRTTQAGILRQYNVEITDPTNWDDAEFNELCKAITKTAQALYSLAISQSGGQTYTDIAHAFKVIMTDNPNSNNDLIVFEQNLQNGQVPSYNCVTTKNLDTNGRSASVNCGQNSGTGQIISEYTFAHELGHVFVGRTTRIENGLHPCAYTGLSNLSFNACIEKPRTEDDDGSFGNANLFVWGNRSQRFTFEQVQSRINKIGLERSADFLTYDTQTNRCLTSPPQLPTGASCTTLSDWQRGNRGWGSPAQQFGHCDQSAPSNFSPTSFQQNPCVFVSWLQSNPTGLSAITEIEETAADMFLNWVYRQQILPSGFSNTKWVDWIDNPTCLGERTCLDNIITNFYLPSFGPGDDRTAWMSQILSNFVTYYGW